MFAFLFTNIRRQEGAFVQLTAGERAERRFGVSSVVALAEQSGRNLMNSHSGIVRASGFREEAIYQELALV